jgi:hypothetical protein
MGCNCGKYQEGGTIEKTRTFNEFEYNKLVDREKKEFFGYWSGYLWDITHKSSPDIVGKFNPKTKILYIFGNSDLNNPLVKWLQDNSKISREEYEKLENGGRFGQIHKRNLATNSMYKKQMEWESKVEKEGEFVNGGGVQEYRKGGGVELSLHDKLAIERAEKEVNNLSFNILPKQKKAVIDFIVKGYYNFEQKNNTITAIGGKRYDLNKVIINPNGDFYIISKKETGGGVYSRGGSIKGYNNIYYDNKDWNIYYSIEKEDDFYGKRTFDDIVIKDSDGNEINYMELPKEETDLIHQMIERDMYEFAKGGHIKYAQGGHIGREVSKCELEDMVGKKLDGWNDDIIFYGGKKYEKCFLRPYYKVK